MTHSRRFMLAVLTALARRSPAIQQAESDGNPATDADATWTPLLTAPPFPSYPSTHSTFSSAGAEILQLFFGTDEVKFLLTAEDGGSRRAFPSFSHAAEEAGRSRVYGGLHYEFDNQDGLAAGKALGQFVYSHYLRPVPQPAVVPTPETPLLWRISG